LSPTVVHLEAERSNMSANRNLGFAARNMNFCFLESFSAENSCMKSNLTLCLWNAFAKALKVQAGESVPLQPDPQCKAGRVLDNDDISCKAVGCTWSNFSKQRKAKRSRYAESHRSTMESAMSGNPKQMHEQTEESRNKPWILKSCDKESLTLLGGIMMGGFGTQQKWFARGRDASCKTSLPSNMCMYIRRQDRCSCQDFNATDTPSNCDAEQTSSGPVHQLPAMPATMAAAQMMKPGDGKLSRYVLRAYGSRQQREKTSSEKTRNAELQTGGGADSLPQSEPPAPSDSKRLMGAQPKSDTRMLCDLRTTRECCVHVRANQRTTGEQSAQPNYASDALAATNQQASKRLSPTI
jgi:hypothetical protein